MNPSLTSSRAASAASTPPDFTSLLAAVRTHVDAQLRDWLRPRVAAARDISDEVGAAASAVERLALRGGKRMRAALIVAGYAAASSGAAGVDFEAALRATGSASVAMELLQVYLLVHDDWMDDDDVRRGGPSVHVELRERLGGRRLGDSAAVLAGDLANAYAQAALLESPVPEARVLAAARSFARIQEEVVSGQLAEISPMIAKPGGRLPPSVELIHSLKTASYTVTGPLALGARLAGASDAKAAQLGQYGRPLGIAFQLRDDVLGVFGDESATGKPVGNDLRQGKRTTLVTEAEKDPGAAALLASVLGRPDATDAEVASAAAAIEKVGARARVEARVAELLAESRAALASLELPEGSVAQVWLAGAVKALGERAS
ncbi:MAG: Octaprenyl diphosphate synthase [Labilithrix sp.]|nr:Octaprenyl diphosphate synthase [Labilithrix sp.]